MKSFEVILLKFISPVHFGDAADGGGLEDIIPYCRADTFFSALCKEAADISSELLEWLLERAKSGDIRISDLLPWREFDHNYELYIPRPIMSVQKRQDRTDLSFEEVKEQSRERKKQKKRSFIRTSEIKKYLHGEDISDQPEFGKEAMRTQFNGREKLPYPIAAYHFGPDAGLYVLLSGDNEDLQKLETLIRMTGLSGIGGKRSSGYGKYKWEDDPLFLSEDAIYGGDDAVLYKMLSSGKADYYMALSSVLPMETELETAENGTGKLIKRGGISWSRNMEEPHKTNNIYMMTAGSCFTKPLEGRVADVNNGSAPHPIYKYGKGLFVGLSL